MDVLHRTREVPPPSDSVTNSNCPGLHHTFPEGPTFRDQSHKRFLKETIVKTTRGTLKVHLIGLLEFN